jgi:hypothetical protein
MGKINTIPSFISFQWLVCHNKLATRVLLKGRNVIDEDICGYAQAQPTRVHWKMLMHILKIAPLCLVFGPKLGSPLGFFFLSLSNWVHATFARI